MPIIDETQFKGKTVLVTGSSKGVGREIALSFAQMGANVVVNYNTDEKGGKDVYDKCVQLGSDALLVKADVSKTDDIDEMFRQITEKYKGLDVLVNNAAIYKDSVVWKMSDEVWDDVVSVDLTGVFKCTRNAIKLMREKGQGRVITVSSVVGQVGGFGVSNYAASKAGVIGFSKSVSKEVATKNITVNAITLGYIETGMLLALPESVREQILPTIPMKRWGHVYEVTSTVLFLASKEAGYITGQSINVNGGNYV
ncbi:MAG: 3-oxoacyl-ACP reductase family protein [Thermoplasmata archaeon]